MSTTPSGNHESLKSKIPKRKKARSNSQLSCKIKYYIKTNSACFPARSAFFTDDTFVPATFMIIFRNLPMRWWLWAIALYAVRVGLTQDVGLSAAGLFAADLGWQWFYWQGVVIAP